MCDNAHSTGAKEVFCAPTHIREAVFGTAMRDSNLCQEFIGHLLGREVQSVNYLSRCVEKPFRGVTVDDPLGDMFACISSMSGKRTISEVASNLQKLQSVPNRQNYYQVVVALDGICDVLPQVFRMPIRTPEGDTELILIDATREDPNVSREIKEFMEIVRTHDVNEYPSAKAIKSDFGKRILRIALTVLADLYSHENVDGRGINFSNLPALITQKSVLEKLISAAKGKDVHVSNIDTEDRWFCDALCYADGWTAVSTFPAPIPRDWFLHFLYNIPGIEVSTQVRENKTVIAITGFDALGLGHCYYRIGQSVTNLAVQVPVPSDTSYLIYCVPNDGMIRDAPEEIQELLDILAEGETKAKVNGHLIEMMQKYQVHRGYRSELLFEEKTNVGRFAEEIDRRDDVLDNFLATSLVASSLDGFLFGYSRALAIRVHAHILVQSEHIPVEDLSEQLNLSKGCIEAVLCGGQVGYHDFMSSRSKATLQEDR